MTSHVYGFPSPDIAKPAADAVQLSPLVPGSTALEEIAPASSEGMVIAAPPGTLERRYVLALALMALKPGAPLTVLAPNEKGGTRLAKELSAFGCKVSAASKRHHRICHGVRPEAPDQAAIDKAIADGAPRFDEALGHWTQPGIFSWNTLDPGTLLLISSMPHLSGLGADLGCGLGVLAAAVLAHPGVVQMHLVDIDRRAIAAARRNMTDPRVVFHWSDARGIPLRDLDFVVMNPPFHDGGAEDKVLGQAFIRQSHQVLRPGGTAWLVANRHLPYEATLSSLFAEVGLRAEHHGFKVYETRK